MKRWISDLLAQPRDTAPPPARAGLRRKEESAWWHVMGFNAGPPRCLANVERRFRKLAARAHPDRGGSPDQMQALLEARAEARRQLSLIRDRPARQSPGR